MKPVLIVGAGFSGAVLAHRLSTCIAKPPPILVLDEKDHIAGNSYTVRDAHTGIMEHRYGPHIFHTSNETVWKYVNSFVPFKPFVNRVKAVYKGNVFSLPINLHTINQFFGKNFSPEEAYHFIQTKADTRIIEPKNFEEQALKFVGKELYEAFFYGYTKKQWGCEPKELPASILKRLPVRFHYDDNYYNDTYQGIPVDGYTEVIRKMLDFPNVQVQLCTQYSPQNNQYPNFKTVFYTGPIDKYFGYSLGRLSYRTVYFEKHTRSGDFQGNAVINYSDPEIAFTRIHEHKHFTPWENFSDTIYFKEYSKETSIEDVPYYPKRLQKDIDIYTQYEKLVKNLKNTIFLGRLATYRYMDMHHVIEESMQIADQYILSNS